MSDKVDTAVRGLKVVGTEITQWENRLEFVKTECKRATEARDALDAQIAKKSSDYASYMAQKDAENKKMRQDVMAGTEQLAKDKAEFQEILKQFQKDKALATHERNDINAERVKVQAQKDNIQGFVTAVQRALGLLGL